MIWHCLKHGKSCKRPRSQCAIRRTATKMRVGGPQFYIRRSRVSIYEARINVTPMRAVHPNLRKSREWIGTIWLCNSKGHMVSRANLFGCTRQALLDMATAAAIEMLRNADAGRR